MQKSRQPESARRTQDFSVDDPRSTASLHAPSPYTLDMTAAERICITRPCTTTRARQEAELSAQRRRRDSFSALPTFLRWVGGVDLDRPQARQGGLYISHYQQ